MKTNIELVAYCKAQLGKPYWFGTFGNYPTEALWNNKKAQYPKYYSDARKKKASKYFGAGASQKVHDCIGLLKGFLWSKDENAEAVYNKKQDYSADSYYAKVSADKKGTINTIPEVVGLAVWRKGHFGVYIGNGEVIEAMGFDYGVVKTKLSARDFTHWMYIDEITYAEAEKPTETKSEPIPEAPADKVTVHIVKKGDTLSQIASKYRVRLSDLVAWNKIENPNLIIIGQKIIIKNLTADTKPVEPSFIKAEVATNGSNLNIRDGASDYAKIIGSLKNGSIIDLESASGNWYKLTNNRGYVFAKWVKVL